VGSVGVASVGRMGSQCEVASVGVASVEGSRCRFRVVVFVSSSVPCNVTFVISLWPSEILARLTTRITESMERTLVGLTSCNPPFIGISAKQ
jgi:hypothetical protein